MFPKPESVSEEKRTVHNFFKTILILSSIALVLLILYNYGRQIKPGDGRTSPTESAAPTEIVYPNFKSDVFKTVFERKYGKKTVSDIKAMRSLDLSNCELEDIRDIAMFTGLTTLVLNDNHIKDVTPLEKLYGLTVLNIGGNDITDINCLSHLTALTELNVRQNTIGSINVVANMPNLTNLTAYSCGLTDISVLRSCPLLEHVSIGYYNDITDISPLFDLPLLKEIKLKHLDIQDSQKDMLKALFPNAVFEW